MIKDTNVTYSPQIEAMGVIDLSEDFSLERKYFVVKNEGEDVTLEVRLANNEEFVQTTFYNGWNVELVSEIKAHDDAATLDLKWGY